MHRSGSVYLTCLIRLFRVGNFFARERFSGLGFDLPYQEGLGWVTYDRHPGPPPRRVHFFVLFYLINYKKNISLMLTPRCNALCVNFDIITLFNNHKKLFNICTVYHRIVALFQFFISEKICKHFFQNCGSLT